MTPRTNILIIEDQVVLSMDLEEQLISYGYHVVGAARTGRQALSLFDDYPVDLVLCDIGLPGDGDGIQTMNELMLRRPVPIVYLTGHTDSTTFIRAQATNPVAFLAKPYEHDALRRAIENALSNYSLRFLKPRLLVDEPEVTTLLEGHRLPRVTTLRKYKTTNNDKVFIRQDGQFIGLCLGDILYLEANDTVTIIVTASQRYPVPLPLSTVLSQLANNRLTQTHRTFAVNLDQVESFSEWQIWAGGHILPLGRIYRTAFLENFPYC
ncbi:response regulator [Spirosoma flavum]|uniref:Response regulator n=1 Tax=Spirosoma flavum TaxID=2048557 RepID=A0ABW6AUL2_9BACT